MAIVIPCPKIPLVPKDAVKSSSLREKLFLKKLNAGLYLFALTHHFSYADTD